MRNPDKPLHPTLGHAGLDILDIEAIFAGSIGPPPGDGKAYAVLADWIFMARRLRNEAFESGLFADPAWDILLDLYAAQARGERVQISSLSPMSGVPPSTARRWVRKLVEVGLLEREKDPRDRRLSFLRLSEKGVRLMSTFFVTLLAKGGPVLRWEEHCSIVGSGST